MNEITTKIWIFLYATTGREINSQGQKFGGANGPLSSQVPTALQINQMFFNLSTFLSIAIEILGNILLRTVKTIQTISNLFEFV